MDEIRPGNVVRQYDEVVELTVNDIDNVIASQFEQFIEDKQAEHQILEIEKQTQEKNNIQMTEEILLTVQQNVPIETKSEEKLENICVQTNEHLIQDFWKISKKITKSLLHEKSLRELQVLCQRLNIKFEGRKPDLENHILRWAQMIS